MTPVLFVLAASGGAVARHLLGRLACSWQSLIVANTIGAAVLGWLVAHDVDPSIATIVGTAMCGTLTTFSSVALEIRTLGLRFGAVYAASTLVSVTGAASLAATF